MDAGRRKVDDDDLVLEQAGLGGYQLLGRTPVELYDLQSDPHETRNLASEKPDLVGKAEALLRSSRVDSVDFPLQVKGKGKAKAAKVK